MKVTSHLLPNVASLSSENWEYFRSIVDPISSTLTAMVTVIAAILGIVVVVIRRKVIFHEADTRLNLTIKERIFYVDNHFLVQLCIGVTNPGKVPVKIPRRIIYESKVEVRKLFHQNKRPEVLWEDLSGAGCILLEATPFIEKKLQRQENTVNGDRQVTQDSSSSSHGVEDGDGENSEIGDNPTSTTHENPYRIESHTTEEFQICFVTEYEGLVWIRANCCQREGTGFFGADQNWIVDYVTLIDKAKASEKNRQESVRDAAAGA